MNFRLKHGILAIAASLTAVSISATPVNIQVLSATIKDQKIANAQVILQKNGSQSISGTTDAMGHVQLDTPNADTTDSLLIIKKPGYSNLVAKCPCADMTYALSPEMKNLDGIRIVLNWGAEPRDLDSHLVYPNNHVYFAHKIGEQADLDVDDTTSYGPETITINKKQEGQRYFYAVHDFSDSNVPNTTQLSESNAKVFVYVGKTLIKTYYVPKHQKGNVWTVFSINENGEIVDYNSLHGVTSTARLQTEAFHQVIDHTQALTFNASNDAYQEAVRMNRQGEQAYQQHDLDGAIALFQSAIELDPNYGQAYSNLGLVFQKAGRVAEALWANRKAIALANGSHAETTRANSYYNNGKIYENAGQWNDALREYHNAKHEKDKPTYDQAIERMIGKGAN
jgi:hypothetical protein